MRHRFTLLALSMSDQVEEEAKNYLVCYLERLDMIVKICNKFDKFRQKILKIDLLLHKNFIWSKYRTVTLELKMKYEYQNLKLIYQELATKVKDKQKKKTSAKMLELLEAFDIDGPETKAILKKYQKKLQTDDVMDYWVCKFAMDSTDSDFE